MKMSPEFILDRLEIIGGSAHERESGNDTIGRMVDYLASHKAGNEESMREALQRWINDRADPKASCAKILLMDLALREGSADPATSQAVPWLIFDDR